MKKAIVLLYAFLLPVLAGATFWEASVGSSMAHRQVYDALWFAVLWLLLAVLSGWVLVRKRVWKNLPVLSIHAALLLICFGLLWTSVFGKTAKLHLYEGESAGYCIMDDTYERLDFEDFSVKLDSFRVRYYPNTERPVDYQSYLTIEDKNGSKQAVVSMNHIQKIHAFRFCQFSYDSDLKGSFFRVNRDAIGIKLSYAGYVLFGCAVLLLLFSRNGRFRQGLLHPLWQEQSSRSMRTGIRLSLYVFWLLALAFSTLLLIHRWWQSGHIPLGNRYESLLFLAWCLLWMSFVLRKKMGKMALSGLLFSCLLLLILSLSSSEFPAASLVPVLRSPWLSVHVSFIIVSYGLFCLMALNSLMALLSPYIPFLRSHTMEKAQVFGHSMLVPAVGFLGTGIFLGSVWANVSWGHYWEWDPKEVWALITLMVYAIGFHDKSLPKLRQAKAFHFFCLLAFLSVLMTYFGMNVFLGGKHSY